MSLLFQKIFCDFIRIRPTALEEERQKNKTESSFFVSVLHKVLFDNYQVSIYFYSLCKFKIEIAFSDILKLDCVLERK